MSTIFINTSSIAPPFIPETEPYIVPKIKEINDVKKAIDKETLVPKIILLNMSLPSSSVPKRLAIDGDLSKLL